MQNETRIPAQHWVILGSAAVMLSLAMGMRQSFGLFQPHVIRDVGVTAADFSLAISIQNMVWGVTQPFIGLLADRFGARWVMVAGTLVYMAGLVAMIFATGVGMVIIGAGVCVGLALSCTASSVAMMVTSRTVSAAKRSLAMGAVSAIGSLGLVLAAPLAQNLINTSGWQIALVAFLGLAAVMIPAAFLAGRADNFPIGAMAGSERSVGETVRMALGHSGYVVMALAFFVCGLQLVFLTTHLPTYLQICGMDPGLGASTLALIGLFNVIGSYLFGWLGGIYPKQYLLGGIYLLRSLAVALYFMFPPSVASTLVFGAAMGTLWLGVVPLVNGLVAQLFGIRYMATLTGIAFLSHQVGSFLGAWGGGLIYDSLGSYDRAWQAAVLVGVVAGLAQMTMSVSPPTPKDAPGVPVPSTA